MTDAGQPSYWAAKALARYNTPTAIAGMVAALESGKGELSELAFQLGRLKVKGAVNGLCTLAENPLPQLGYARRHAVMSLEIIGDRRAIPSLQKALNDRDEGVRERAASALKAFGVSHPQVNVVASGTPHLSLDAVVMIFDRPIPNKSQVFSSVLHAMHAHGKTYAAWFGERTPWATVVSNRLNEPTVVAATASIEFRSMIGEKFHLDNVEMAPFTGPSGITGIILSHWCKGG